MMKIRRSLLNLFILFITICITGITAEILIKVFSGRTLEDKWVGPSKRFYKYNPLLGWSLIPNTKTTRVSEGGKISVLYQINSKGIRGPEYSYNKADKEYRILILGDSFSEGYMVEFDELFSEIMARKLEKINVHKHFVAINSGTAGWSTDQELLFFQNEGKKYKPNLTILMFYQNDLAYNNQPKDWGMYYKPLFKIKNDKLVLTNVPVPMPDRVITNDYRKTERKSIFNRLKKWLHRNSHLYGFIKERINNTYFLNNLAIKLHLIEDKSENEDDFAYSAIYKFWEKKYDESVYETWRITEAMIQKLKDETDTIGSKLLIFYIPDEANVNPEVWINIKKKHGFSDKNMDINQVAFHLRDICEKKDIDFFNPTELFIDNEKKLKKNDKSLYNSLDRHWNVYGNRFVGEILADYVAEKYLGDKNGR